MIPDIEPVNTWSGNSSATRFDFDFLINNASELTVLHTDSNGVQNKLELNTDYTINQIGQEDGSYITFPIVGSTYSVLSSSEKISLLLDIPVAQTSPYGTSSRLDLDSLEYSLDYLTRLIQIQKRQVERSVKVQEGSDISTDTLALNLNKVADISTDVSTVAGNIANVQNVSSNITNVNYVGNDITNVNAVGGSISNVNTVAGNLTNVDTVAANISDVNTVSNIFTDISTIANIAEDITAVKNNATDISTVATDLSNINNIAADLTNIDNASNYATSARQYAVGLPVEPFEGSAKYWAERSHQEQIQSDWYETNTTSKAYIKNKPTKVSDFRNDSGYTSNTGTVTSVNGIQPDVNGNVALTIPTPNNGTLIITQEGATLGIFEANQSINTTIEIPAGSCYGYEVGDIVFRLNPSKDGGKHVLDGTLFQYGSYKALIDEYADLYGDGTNIPSFFTNETTWQAVVSAKGSCGKFVYDPVNKTLRIPKISNIIEGTTDLTALGDLVEAGLPNIGAAWNTVVEGSPAGAVRIINSWGDLTDFGDGGGWGTAGTLDFYASRSSSIYRNDVTTVQPQTIKGLYYIVIATSTKTDIQVDIDEIATDLNGKADVDLTNITTIAPILGMLQTTDSSKVGYIYRVRNVAASVYAPAGGKWLVLRNEQVQNSSAVVFKFWSGTLSKDTGTIVNGGEQVADYTTQVSQADCLIYVTLLKIA